MTSQNILIRLPNSLELSAAAGKVRPRRAAVEANVVIDVESTAVRAPRLSRRRLPWIAAALLLCAIVVSGGARTMIQAATSGSAVVLGGPAATSSVDLPVGGYCPALPGGLDEMKRAGLIPNAPRFYWIVRQFGGRLIGAGETVEILERGSQVTQVRDPQTSSICYLSSNLVAER
jgi:hypothetical protein